MRYLKSDVIYLHFNYTYDYPLWFELDTRCQFHQCFIRAFFVQKFVQSQNVIRKKAFVRKICVFNVDEIDHWRFSFNT